MRILIAYASTEGQTRKICRAAADTLIDLHHSVELLPVSEAEGVDPLRFDGVILGASVHVGAYQPEVIAFGTAHAAALAQRPTLFLAVSLAAAGTDRDEHDDLDRIARKAFATMGWTPDRTEQVAGAFRFTEYDFFKGWAMRYIAAQHGQTVDPHTDTEYTDWAALEAIVTDWAARLPGSGGQ